MHLDFRLKYCLFAVVKLTNNTGRAKYVYTGYGTGFDSRSRVSILSFDFVKNVIIFGVDISSSTMLITENTYFSSR